MDNTKKQNNLEKDVWGDDLHQSWMLYCCGSKEKGEAEHARAGQAVQKTVQPHTDTTRKREEPSLAGMYEMSDMPELLPPSSVFESLRAGPHVHPEPQHLRGQISRDCPCPESPQRSVGQRAPKLGQIGRSKRVVIEDEDLGDVMDKNGQVPVSLSHAPA
ncbi:uncharacterized protein LOC143525437 [Brachyhypopomus gauderio]|uniref:uncharacterized protein LOC143525437 n=1 Tax=Brachyhypopomus gauderio TaxID=698409 RepID=UPI0040413177